MSVERAILEAVARADLFLCAAGRLLAWALPLGGVVICLMGACRR